MIVMPSNNTGSKIIELHKLFPKNVALLLNTSVGYTTEIQFTFTYAIDNNAFSRFHENNFFNLLDRSKKHNKPLFVVCPDVVGCHDRTYALYHYYEKRIRKYKYKIAFVAQDGCEPSLIPKSADWIFVGGKDPWKMNNIHKFVGLGKPVHVGRVNTINRLEYCNELGVDSIDGTGWCRFGKVDQLKNFLRKHSTK